MELILSHTVGLLIAAIIVALLARRLRLPYTVGLVAAGTGLTFMRVDQGIVLTHDFIFDVVLPPLLFEAALNIHWKELSRDSLPVLSLSLLGTLISAAVVAAGMVFILNWQPTSAILFGVLISATDPVAVIAMFKDNRVAGRMRLLVESESLFNDGIAAVLFTMALSWAQETKGNPITLAAGALVLLFTVGGGIVAGLSCAGAAIAVAGHTSDFLVEGTLTTVTAYGSFLLSEHFHCSGVLATVTAGLLMGNLGVLIENGESPLSDRGREFVLALWDFIAFIANSLVFLLIGLAVAHIRFDALGLQPLLGLIALVLLARALTVYPLCLLFARSRWVIPLSVQHILWWGGLRGAVGMALALSLPSSFPHKGDILVATFGVVVFSVVVQGLTMPLLLRKLAFTPK
jgi:CPA1 family monovalent cation:H+ antiporter